jgi:hypothetical protein
MTPDAKRRALIVPRGALAWPCLAFALAVAACAGPNEAGSQAGAAQAKPQAPATAGMVDPYRQILVIGPSARFDSARLPADWYVASRGKEPVKFVAVQKDGVLALRLDGDNDGAILGRRLHVPLLNMPFLRWGWYVEPSAPPAKRGGGATGPAEPSVLLRVVVGFRDGIGTETGADGTDRAPKIDRALSLEWRAEETAARGAPGSFAIQAGRRGSGRWIIEAVDLSRLYAQAWPQSAAANTAIAFVAVGAGPAGTPVTGYVAEVVLSP